MTCYWSVRFVLLNCSAEIPWPVCSRAFYRKVGPKHHMSLRERTPSHVGLGASLSMET